MKYLAFGAGKTRIIHRISFRKRNPKSRSPGRVMITLCGVRPGPADTVINNDALTEKTRTCRACQILLRRKQGRKQGRKGKGKVGKAFTKMVTEDVHEG